MLSIKSTKSSKQQSEQPKKSSNKKKIKKLEVDKLKQYMTSYRSSQDNFPTNDTATTTSATTANTSTSTNNITNITNQYIINSNIGNVSNSSGETQQHLSNQQPITKYHDPAKTKKRTSDNGNKNQKVIEYYLESLDYHKKDIVLWDVS